MDRNILYIQIGCCNFEFQDSGTREYGNRMPVEVSELGVSFKLVGKGLEE